MQRGGGSGWADKVIHGVCGQMALRPATCHTMEVTPRATDITPCDPGNTGSEGLTTAPHSRVRGMASWTRLWRPGLQGQTPGYSTPREVNSWSSIESLYIGASEGSRPKKVRGPDHDPPLQQRPVRPADPLGPRVMWLPGEGGGRPVASSRQLGQQGHPEPAVSKTSADTPVRTHTSPCCRPRGPRSWFLRPSSKKGTRLLGETADSRAGAGTPQRGGAQKHKTKQNTKNPRRRGV